MSAPSTTATALAGPQASTTDPAFDRDRFLLRQRVWTVHEKYEVWDDEGRPILYVERPGHHLKNLGALLAGLAALFLVGGGILAAAAHFDSVLLLVIGVIAGLVALLLVVQRLAQKRHVTFYRDQSKAERLFDVLQDQTVTVFTQTFTVRDAAGRTLARLGKNPLTDILRKKWTCDAPDGRRLCVAREDLWHAIVSRIATKLFPMNFSLYEGEGPKLVGRFDRKFTLLDRYVLDLTPDRGRVLDRRIALALGVLLDTAERR